MVNLEAIYLALRLLLLDPSEIKITVVGEAPKELSYTQKEMVQAWVNTGSEHDDTIFVAGWSKTYKNATKGKDDAVIALAAVIAHEKCHLGQSVEVRMKGGAAMEGPCYDVQLETLKQLKGSRGLQMRILEARKYVAGR